MPREQQPRATRSHGHGHKGNVKDAGPPLANERRRRNDVIEGNKADREKPRATKAPGDNSPPVVDKEEAEITNGHGKEDGDQQQQQAHHLAPEINEDHRWYEEGREEEGEEEQVDQTEYHVKLEREQPTEGDAFKKCNMSPENFNVREFNTNMTEFVRSLQQPRYNQVDTEYPVQELTSLVNMVTKTVNDYKIHTSDSQYQLHKMTETMAQIRENLHFSVSRQAMDMRTDGTNLTQDERDLQARAAKLTAALAKANADVTEAIRLTTETESVAVKADIAAERAREEAQRIEAEARIKEEADRKKREEERRKMERVRKMKEEEERKEREAQQKKEDEWKKREALSSETTHANVYDSWPEVAYEHTNQNGDKEVTCIIRGDPVTFAGNAVTCRVASEKEASVTYLANEEIISHVVDLEARGENEDLKKPIYVAIPHLMTRSSGQSREPVVKAMMDGQWVDLPTRDIALDSKKDNKFAQAEVHRLTTLVVMSRFKRDYVTLPPSRPHTVTSSVDHRLAFTINKYTFSHNEHFLLEVQPIDTTTLQDFRSRHASGKSLLTSSSIVHTTWEAGSFKKPVQVTVGCPPNPAKARKMALARKLKEEKMKNPVKPVVPFEEQEKAKEKENKRVDQYMDENGELKKVTKWYMGQYANTEDDESDAIHFLHYHGGRWFLEPEMRIKQIKVDMVSFTLEQPVERFMVVRTRPNVDEETVLQLVTSLTEFLTKKFVEAVVRQRSDDPFEVALHVSPLSHLDVAIKSLEQNGYESGPAPSHVICLHEGDVIELGFSGNIECRDQIADQLIYKTNVPTVTNFRVTEENKFRQKDQDFYSGLIVLTRRYMEAPHKGKKAQDQEPDQLEVKRDRLCALQINIPKYHIEPNTEPKRAPVTLRTASEPVDNDLLLTLADGLGEEWRKVAHYLGVRRARVQAIVRNMNIGERSEREAKYDMLMTWMKAAPKALDKVTSLSSALSHSERDDLAEQVQERGREFWGQRRLGRPQISKVLLT